MKTLPLPLPPFPRVPGARHCSWLVALLLLGGALSSQAALVGYWKFDEGSGTNTADSSGAAVPLNGQLSVTTSGAQLPQWIAGRFGGALDFNRLSDANGGRVVVNNNTNLWLNGPFTISFWYRPGPNIGTFPGPMRIGNQAATTGTTIGWGYFRSGANNTVLHKRGNAQPAMYPTALVNGRWYHIVLRYGGTGATTNNAIIFGLSTNTTTQAWLACTATSIFEFGRMDQHDDCDLDDVALFDEALPLERLYQTDTVPNNLSLDYSLGDVRSLWSIYDSANGTGTVKGITWTRTNSLPGSTTPGDAYLSGTRFYVVFAPNAALTASAVFLGDMSPGGIAIPGTTTFPETPTIGASARLIFDLSSTPTVGAGVNDLYEITGNLVLSNNTVVVNPLSALANGTYRLINYTGTKTGSVNTNVVHNSRYTFTLDESTPGQINLVVSGANASLGWFSSANGSWDLTSLNWTNSIALAASQFRQADAVSFDESGSFGTNISVSLDVWPQSVTVSNSTNRIYTLSGSGRIGGMQGGLTKQGNGLLALSTPNQFLGPINLNEGTLRVGNAAALGATNGATLVANGAVLDLNGISPGAEPVSVRGSGINNTGAVINTGAALVNNGLLGPVTLTGDLTVGGINRWDMFGGRLFGNGFKLTKTGPPEIALSNLGDTGLGDVEVRQGQLTVLGSTLMGDAAKPIVVTNATLAHWASGTNIHNKPVSLSASTYAANSSGDMATNVATLTLAAGTNTVGGSAGLALLGRITGPGALVKSGAGTVRIGGTNDYTGFTAINGGTLLLQGAGSIAASTNVTLAAGTVLDVTNRTDATFSVAPGQVLAGVGTVRGSLAAGTGALLSPGLSAGTLLVTSNLTLSGGATLAMELGAFATEGGGTNDLISAGGGLNLAGVNTLRIIPVGNLLLNTPYNFLAYTGALSGSAANFTVASDSRLNFTVSTATPGRVSVSATGGSALQIEWTGGLAALPTTWDTRNSGNWLGAIFGDQFYAGDTVVFNDFATEFSVTLSGDLYPANTQVEAEVSNYVFSGPGRLRGGGINKSLAGKLTIANTGLNDYPGPTVIASGGGTIQVGTGGTFGNLGPGPILNDGTLILNRSDDITLANVVTGAGNFRKDNTNLLVLGATLSNYNGTLNVTGGQIRPTVTNGLGTPVGGTTIGPGATLQINGINLYAEPVTASGSGIDGNGAIVNNGSGQNNALMFLTLAGDLTVGGAARWDVRANPTAAVLGNGYKLTKTNAAQFSMVSVGETGLGDIDVKQGTLSVEGSTGLGATGTVTVESNATLFFYGSTVTQAKNFVLRNGARILKDLGTVTLTGTGSLNGSNALESASNSGTDFFLGGVLSGAGFINKLGAGNVILTTDNTYSGGTLVSAGNLILGNGATNGSVPGLVTVNGGGFFYWLSNQITLPNNVIGAGSLYLRTAGGLILDGSKEIVMTNNSVEVGRDFYGKLIVRNGANSFFGRLNLGNISGTVGEVIHEGGNLWLTLETRVGHWPNNTSTYLMGGGSLNMTNLTNGLVVNASTEYQGILYLGVDGTGVFTQTGGVVIAQGIVLDNRGDTAGTDTFNLEGGTFNLGPYGIQSGNNNANTTYLVNLGGGTLRALTNWSSSRLITLTGTNGDVTLDTGTNLVVLSGVLSGPGGLKKAGAGTLRLSATNTFLGTARVDAGTLEGNTILSGPLLVTATGTLSPGVAGQPGGSLTVTGALTLGGTLLMEIGKTNTIRTNDVLSVAAPLAYSGTLTVVASGSALASGDTFKLFNAPAYGGTFSSLNLPVLAAGLVWDLKQLPINGTIRVTDNLPPVPGFTSLATVQNRGVTYAISKLVELARDPENDPISFVSVGASTNGATVGVVGDRLSYTPVLNFIGADRVSYVIADNRGGLNLGQLEVLVYPGNLAGLNILSVITVNGNPQLTFAGIPGRTYGIERAPSVTGPWTQVSTVVCDPLGLTSYTDTSAPAGTSFYRTSDLTAP